ncbi:MAG: SIS domain-containing protein, partial [Tidjanibacter sp.]|nr:SIS domain-containing protein [Tidjanibacter sp.]
MIALTVAKEKGTISEEKAVTIARDLYRLPKVLEKVLTLNNQIADFVKRFTYAKNFIYLGRGYNYPTALEGALKLKEISYIHAEGYPAAEMKHGPIALIDQDMPTVAIAVTDHVYEKVVSNIQEVKSRGGVVIAIVAEKDEIVSKMADFCIKVPSLSECLMPIVVAVPLQLFAYHIAVCKGLDVDQPRNLAKSVTVE